MKSRWISSVFTVLTMTFAWSLNADGCCCQSKLPGVTSPSFSEVQLKWVAKPYSPDFSSMLIAEGGNRSARGNATFAWRLCPKQWWKFSYEYLTQKLPYDFGVGKDSSWRQQSGAGLEYRHAFLDDCIVSAFNLSGYLSYAPSRELSKGLCHKSLTEVRRRIAGSHAWGMTAGIEIPLVLGPAVDILLNARGVYDHVEFIKKFSHREEKEGWGGLFDLQLYLPYCVDIKLLAELRNPLNYYRGVLEQRNFLSCAGLTGGLFASYTQGKERLPSHAAFGIQLAYFWQPDGCCQDVAGQGAFDLYWATTPAYYQPEVFAVSEKKNLVGS